MKSQQVSGEENNRLCPRHNALEQPHMPPRSSCMCSIIILAGRSSGATLWGPQGSGKGQATLGSTAGMNGLAASWASCSKLYQRAALTDGSPLEKPPATACVALALAFCSPCTWCHESGYKLCKRGQHTFKNTRAWFGTLLTLSSTKQVPLEGQAGSLQWRYLWRKASFLFEFAVGNRWHLFPPEPDYLLALRLHTSGL